MKKFAKGQSTSQKPGLFTKMYCQTFAYYILQLLAFCIHASFSLGLGM